jgi:hypothetical protein
MLTKLQNHLKANNQATAREHRSLLTEATNLKKMLVHSVLEKTLQLVKIKINDKLEPLLKNSAIVVNLRQQENQ